MVRQNTRKQNCLDNFLINFTCESKVSAFDSYLSDHEAVSVNMSITRNLSQITKTLCRPFTQTGLNILYQNISKVSWEFIEDDGLNVNEKTDLILKILTENLNKAFPQKLLKTKSSRQNICPTWYNDELRSIREKLKLLQEFRKLFPESPDISGKITSLRSHYRNKIKYFKKQENDRYISAAKNTQKAIWNILNRERPSVNKDKSVNLNCDLFNNYFANIGFSISSNINSTTDPSKLVEIKCDTKFTFHEITFINMRDLITTMGKNTSRDVYELNINIIKYIKDLIIVPLTKLFNQCINRGIFPDALKVSKTIPIFKNSGSLNEIQNYRPISIIPTLGKIFEKFLNKQLMEYFEKHDLLYSKQFGFRSNRSTTAALCDITNQISEAIEKKKLVGSIFCDLSKAFDCVNHSILLHKLDNYGIENKSLDLISSYLTNRQQRTDFHGKTSNFKHIRCGVPQGSVMGPLLFLIYTNDFPKYLPDSSSTNFADDTTILNFDENEIQLKIKNDNAQSKAIEWFTANRLQLNVNKTKQIIFSTNNHNGNIGLVSTKCLGVILNNKLSWEQHVDYVSAKLAKIMYLFRNISQTVSTETLKTAYFSLFQSTYSYALLVWGHSIHLNRIFKLQRKIIRIMYKKGFQEDVKRQFIENNIMTVPCYYIYTAAIYVKTNVGSYDLRGNLHSHNIRNSKDISLELLKLNRNRNAQNFFGPKFFNHLPQNIRDLHLHGFKRSLKKYLLDKAFYSLNEFFESHFDSI